MRLSAATTTLKGLPPGTASVADKSLQAPGLAASESWLTGMLLTFIADTQCAVRDAAFTSKRMEFGAHAIALMINFVTDRSQPDVH